MTTTGGRPLDAVLLFGPLYHLTEAADRLAALREAHRVLQPGGLLFAVAISCFASLRDGLRNGWLGDPELRPVVERVPTLSGLSPHLLAVAPA